MNRDNRAALINAQSDWGHARREAMIQDVVCAIAGCPVDLLSFNEVQDRLQLSTRVYRGIQDIDLNHIRGSVGRYDDFAMGFLPRSSINRERWENVDMFVTWQGEGPIEVYKVGDAYFVLDGNHRVSVSRQIGKVTIEAQVWEFSTPVELSSQADYNELLLKSEQVCFLDCTQIARSIPDHEISFTSPAGYHALMTQLETYRLGLEEGHGEPVSMEQAVISWYPEVYSPAVTAIRDSGVLEQFPERTEADLFIWVWENQQDLREFSGYDLRDAFQGISRQRSQPVPAKIFRSIGDVLERIFIRR